MASINVSGKEIEIDEDGFLVDPADWNEDVAQAFKVPEGIEELTDEHWNVINYLRDYFAKFKTAPMVRKLCKDTGCSNKRMYELFPGGPANCACKVAGLPKPTGCV